MKAFRKRYHPPGTAPGTLAVVASEVPLSIRLIDFTQTHYKDKPLYDPAECEPFQAQQMVVRSIWRRRDLRVKAATRRGVVQARSLPYAGMDGA